MPVPPQLDHIIYATPDLQSAVDELSERLGVRASPGGIHPGLGTRNYLLSLGDTCYLEIIGPDPEQGAPANPRPFGIDGLTAPRLITWAIKGDELEVSVARAREAGFDPGKVLPLSRQSPHGLLQWQLTMRSEPGAGGVVPFLIDWGTTPNPAGTSAGGCLLTELRAEHPDPAGTKTMLAALGVELQVDGGSEPAMIAELATPNGPVTLR